LASEDNLKESAVNENSREETLPPNTTYEPIEETPISQNTRETFSESNVKKSTPTGMIIAMVVIVAVAAFFAGSYFSNLNSDTVTQSDLDTAIAKLESKIASIKSPSGQPSQPIRISVDNDPVRGNPDAPITIIEFSDFQCPFCARFHVQTLPSILEEYIDTGKVNLVYRDFPIQSIHPNALPAAVAAECANEQGKYWQYHDTLFERQTSWSKLDTGSVISTFSQYATDIGLDQQQFDSCLGSGKYLQEVQQDLNDGRTYDVTGTPGFFIGNENIGFVKIDGAQPFESFKKVIDSQLGT